jgi:Ca-activated chloride channel family protein
MRALLLLFTVLFGLSAQSSELRGVWRNNVGTKKFESKDSVKALDDFTGALMDLPFSGEVHYNLGNAFLRSREYEKALSEFRIALENSKGNSSIERETRFRALFNSGVAQAELKKTDEALELYQKAIDLKPDSVESKTNIELLTKNGGGGGEGDSDNKDKDQKDKKDKKDGQGKDKDQNQPKPDQKVENPHYKPKEFKSEELTQQDVKRILEELKRQEEQIRARMNNEQAKDAPVGKDW